LKIKNEETKKKIKTIENPLDMNSNPPAQHNSNTSLTNPNNENKIGVSIESNSDKKIMETLFSEKNILKENKSEKIKNFFGEENFNNDKNYDFLKNNISNKSNRINSAAGVSNGNLNTAVNNSNSNSILVNSKANSYFVNSNTHGYNSFNVNFKTNFFLDRELISKNFDVNKIKI